jgi:hypothetical protein
LHIPNLLGFPQTGIDPKELALQITDIITLRPEIEICYVGLFHKCFEILEARPNENNPTTTRSAFSDATGATSAPNGPFGNHAAAADSDGEDADEEETSEDEPAGGAQDDETDAEDGGNVPGGGVDPDETQSDTEATADEDEGYLNDDTDTDDGWEEPNSGAGKLRLREILFYDDKVAVFKARHAQL